MSSHIAEPPCGGFAVPAKRATLIPFPDPSASIHKSAGAMGELLMRHERTLLIDGNRPRRADSSTPPPPLPSLHPPGTDREMPRVRTGGLGIYVRKSTDRQELSLQAQERLIRDFVDHQRITLPVVDVYKDVLSGSRPDRRGYQQMLADARAGKLRMLIFHKINRFGRNAAEGLAAIDDLRRLGVVVRIVDLPMLDVSKPEGMLIFSIMLSQGQYEIENLGNEARKGMEYKFSQGGWPFRAPDGYCNMREEIAARKFRCWVEIDRPRAAIVRLMYRWYAAGNTTLQGIVRRLNQLDAQRTAHGKRGCLRRSGKPWDAQAIYRMLTSRFYLGEVAVPTWQASHAGIHSAIITPARFATVQEVLKRQGHLHNRRHHYLLQDILVLDGEEPIFMRCTSVRRNGREYRYYFRYREDRRQYYAADAIDQQVIKRIIERMATLGADPVQTLRQRVLDGAVEVRRRAQRRMDKLLGERQQLLRMATQGFFSEAEIRSEQVRIEAEERWARAELAQAELVTTTHVPLLDEALAALAALEHWEMLQYEEQRRVIVQMVQQVAMNEAGIVERLEWQPLWELLWFGPDTQR